MGYLMGVTWRNTFNKSIFTDSQNRVGRCCLLYIPVLTKFITFISQNIPYHFTNRAPKTVNGDGNNVPNVARPQGAALSRAQSDLFHSFSGLPVLKNAAISPASFVVSSAPSTELMAATTRTSVSGSVSPKWILKKMDKKRWQKSLLSRLKRHDGHADGYGGSKTQAVPSANLHLGVT